ncbi:MAG: DUF4388 domain-containing protein [Thermoanaerobaculum sp.]
MALTGDFRTLPFPEVIQLVARMEGTGVLRVRRGHVEKAVYFRRGTICSSSSNDPREFLGQYLLRMGLVDEERLFQALLKQEQEKRPLGAILIEQGLLAPDDLEKVLRQKAEETIYDLFLWEQGEFVFHEEPIPENLPVQLNLDVMGVLLEGARRSDEWERIRQLIPSPRATFTPGPIPPADVFEARVVSLAAEGRTAAAMTYELHCSDFEALTLLAELVQKKVLEVKDPGTAERPGDTVSTVKKLLAKAKSAELAGRLEEAEEAYQAVLLINPVHVQARKALVALRERSLTPADASAFSIPAPSVPPAETMPLDSVPRLAADFSTITQLELSPEEGYLLSRINGSWDVKSIARLFPEGQNKALEILSQLEAKGLIRIDRQK